MKLNKILAVLVVGMLSFASLANAQKIEVVTSIAILKSVADDIGGDKISSHSIIPRNASAHGFEAKPQDLMRLKKADIFVINGLHLEAGVDALLESSKFKGEFVVATSGINEVKIADFTCGFGHKHKGGVDPHAWQSPITGKIYAQNIYNALVKIDKKNQAYYEKNLAKFNAQMDKLDKLLKAELKKIADKKKTIITAHRAFNYLGRDYGIKTLGIQGIDNQEGTSAREIANVVKYVRKNHVSAIFFEKDTNPKLVEQVIRHTGAKSGGVLYAGMLTEIGGPADTYAKMLHYNIKNILAALK